jgi:hypothetical protein
MAGGFALNTRRKIVQLAGITRPSGGGTSQINLPKTGLLSKIYLEITGTVGGTVGTVSSLGMASIIQRVRLTANSGIDIFNVSGAGFHYLLREMLESEYIDQFGQTNAKSAVTATTATLDMVIPVALNSRDAIGLILLQNEQTVLTLTIDWTADATVTSTGTFSGFTVTPYLELFTVPVDPADWPALNIVHQILEDQQSVSGSGDYTYNWPRGNTYLQLAHGLGIGASGSDGFNRYKLRVNQSDYLVDTDEDYLDLEHRYLRGRARPAGGIYVDLVGTSGLGTFGTTRDTFNSALVTDLASVITATGSGTLYTVRRQLVVLQ